MTRFAAIVARLTATGTRLWPLSVPERPKFYDWMSVDEIGWFAAGFHKAGFLDRFREWVKKFRLADSAKLRNLSKGEYAKVGFLYAQLGLADRTGIEFFQGGHSINAEGTLAFLHKHLRWPLNRSDSRRP